MRPKIVWVGLAAAGALTLAALVTSSGCSNPQGHRVRGPHGQVGFKAPPV